MEVWKSHLSFLEGTKQKKVQPFSIILKVPRMLFSDHLIVYPKKTVVQKNHQWHLLAITKLNTSNDSCTALFQLWNGQSAELMVSEEIYIICSEDSQQMQVAFIIIVRAHWLILWQTDQSAAYLQKNPLLLTASIM